MSDRVACSTTAGSSRSARRRRSTSGRARASSRTSSASPTCSPAAAERFGAAVGDACGRRRIRPRRAGGAGGDAGGNGGASVALPRRGHARARGRRRRVRNADLPARRRRRPALARRRAAHPWDARRHERSRAQPSRLPATTSRSLGLRALLGPALAPAAACYCSLLLGAAAAVARRGLSRLAVRAARPELLLDRRVLRPVVKREFTLKTYAELLQPANLDIILRTVAMAALVTLASRHRLSDRLLWRAMPRRAGRRCFYLGVMLPLWSSYLVGLRLEADPGQGRHRHLGSPAAASDLAARRAAGAAGDRRAFAVGQLSRHVPRLRLRLAAVHDPADAGGARARAR